MKAVAFVCLLSLSLCLSESTPPEVQKPAPTKPNEVSNATKLDSTAVTPPNVNSTTKPANTTEKSAAPVTPATKVVDENTKGKNETSKPAIDNGGKVKNETKPAEPDTHTEKAAGADSAKSTTTHPDESKTEASTVAPVKPTTEKPAETPKDTTEKPLVAKRGFDGPSFIGGIILTLGLLAIGFMGFKYYKNQTERNYHTL